MMRLLSRATRGLPVDARRGSLSNLAMGLMVLKRGNIWYGFPRALKRLMADGLLSDLY